MRTEEEMVAYALEVDPALLPHIPALLADLDELGSDAEVITAAIAGFALPDGTRVIDLGCGKGAVAVEIADELGFHVDGIDLFEPFIGSARRLAEQNGVANHCAFRQGNVLTMAAELGCYDAAVFAALGDVLGRLDETVRIIREYVKPGGLMIISDVFLAEGSTNTHPAFKDYADHNETLSRLTACGDVIEREILSAAEDEEEEEEGSESEAIRLRAMEIAARHPEIRDALLHFAAEQARENEFIASNLIDAVWVIRKSG